MAEIYLVMYDIADPKRLGKVASVLLDYGFRVQKSVFEVEVGQNGLKQMKNRLKQIIEFGKDGIKIFPLCEPCHTRLRSAGPYPQPANLSHWIVI